MTHSLDCKILLENVTCFGFAAPMIELLESYLSIKKFLYFVEDVFSEVRILKYGVPQGSVMGPVPVFHVCLWPPWVLLESGSYLYADNACIFY